MARKIITTIIHIMGMGGCYYACMHPHWWPYLLIVPVHAIILCPVVFKAFIGHIISFLEIGMIMAQACIMFIAWFTGVSGLIHHAIPASRTLDMLIAVHIIYMMAYTGSIAVSTRTQVYTMIQEKFSTDTGHQHIAYMRSLPKFLQRYIHRHILYTHT